MLDKEQKELVDSVGAFMLNGSLTEKKQVATDMVRCLSDTLNEIANALGADIREFFGSPDGNDSVDGFVEYKNEIHRILSLKDLESLLSKVKNGE